VLKAVENHKTDFTNEVCQDIIDYFHKNIKDETFQETVRENRLRFIRFMFDLPKGKLATTFNQLISNENEKQESAQLIAKTLTTEGENTERKTGRYLVQLIKWNDQRVKNEELVNEGVNLTKV
jgi:hypothetical protein